MPTTLRYPEFDSETDACACPECGMPMSIRLWLRTADCLRCGTSIALDYQRPRPRRQPTAIDLSQLPFAAPVADDPFDQIEIDLSVVPPPILSSTQKMFRSLNRLLACLASMIAHLVMLLLLAILTGGTGMIPNNHRIDLSMEFSEHDREGGLRVVDQQVEPVGFELPLDPQQQREQVEAQMWAEKLVLDDPAAAPNLPPLGRITQNLAHEDRYRRMLSARDPRIRREVLKQEGGTNLTEAAVAKALHWMALHQHSAGNWSLDRFHKVGGCDGECRHRGNMASDAGATALVLQAMLGAGQTHRAGMYQEVVSHGLQYLLSIQRPNGDLTGEGHRQAGMYVHALATIALCDAYALTGDERLREPAELAVDYLCDAQHAAGGWRYTSGEQGDLSVTGWQLMALHTARAAGLEVDGTVLGRASRFLDSVATDRLGSQYAYLPGRGPSPAMTAEGLLSRMYLGWKRDQPGLATGVRELARKHPPNPRDSNIYYWYYATQVFHHWGGTEWRDWNEQVADILVATQVQSGHAMGSWEPKDPHGSQGGRLYMTALATCTLEVYYRHAPLFRKIRLDRQ